jgi:hypothetical protein
MAGGVCEQQLRHRQTPLYIKGKHSQNLDLCKEPSVF